MLSTNTILYSGLATSLATMGAGLTADASLDKESMISFDYIRAFEQKLSSDGYAFQYNEEKQLYNIEIHHTDEAKRLLSAFDEELQDVEIRKGTMDDVFLAVTEGQEFENEE